ncbi:MAG: hypothetical protein ABIM98_07380 [candidate division WOR-3 bacterium]
MARKKVKKIEGTEETKKEETKIEETKKEELKIEETKKEEPKIEELVPDPAGRGLNIPYRPTGTSKTLTVEELQKLLEEKEREIKKLEEEIGKYKKVLGLE